MRKVSVSKRVNKNFEPDYTGYFHKFSRDPDGENVANIETDDGKVVEVMLHLVTFLCSPEDL